MNDPNSPQYNVLGVIKDKNSRPALYANQISGPYDEAGDFVGWSLKSPWEKVWSDSDSADSFYLISITLLPFGSILGVSHDSDANDNYELWLAINYQVDSIEWVKIEYTTTPPTPSELPSVGLRSVAILNDRTMVAVGTDNFLYTCSNYPQNQAIWEFTKVEGSGSPYCITVLQNGKICCNVSPGKELFIADPPPLFTKWIDVWQGNLYLLPFMQSLSTTQDGAILGVSKDAASTGTNLYATILWDENQPKDWIQKEWIQVTGGDAQQLICAWACWGLPKIPT